MTPLDPAKPGDESLAHVRGYLHYLARHHLGDDLHAKGDASDLVQTALLAAHENRGQYHGNSPAEYKGWLRRILVNVARKFRRHWGRQVRAADREVTLDTALVTLDTPSRIARQRERHRQLADAVARLPEEQRQVVVLRAEQSLSFAEVGACLGKSADAARMLFHRALERLQERLPCDGGLS